MENRCPKCGGFLYICTTIKEFATGFFYQVSCVSCGSKYDSLTLFNKKLNKNPPSDAPPPRHKYGY